MTGNLVTTEVIDSHGSSLSMDKMFRRARVALGKSKSTKSLGGPRELVSFAQSETNFIPLFVEKCVDFIDKQGLDCEGLYRVPGNRVQVDLLFEKFDKGTFSRNVLQVMIDFCGVLLTDQIRKWTLRDSTFQSIRLQLL
jgi:hypothetical protein